MISSHSRWVLVSHHNLAGASTRPAAVERHEPVLLARHAYRRHARARRRLHLREARADCLDPPFGFLLTAAVVAGDEFERLPMHGHDAARRGIVGDELDTLRADIESDEQAQASPPGATMLALPLNSRKSASLERTARSVIVRQGSRGAITVPADPRNTLLRCAMHAPASWKHSAGQSHPPGLRAEKFRPDQYVQQVRMALRIDVSTSREATAAL